MLLVVVYPPSVHLRLYRRNWVSTLVLAPQNPMLLVPVDPPSVHLRWYRQPDTSVLDRTLYRTTTRFVPDSALHARRQIGGSTQANAPVDCPLGLGGGDCRDFLLGWSCLLYTSDAADDM
eukprot:1394561-Rhodomonas_salina.1